MLYPIPTLPGVTEHVRADLEVSLPENNGRKLILDVTVANPAAPSYEPLKPHDKQDVAGKRRVDQKETRYHSISHPNITSMTPRRYYTFNLEATGRLCASAKDFIEDLFDAAGRDTDTVNCHCRKTQCTQAALFHKRNAALAQATSHPLSCSTVLCRGEVF